MREFTQSLLVNASTSSVLDAFFDHSALAAWWDVSRSLCIPRIMGSYALEWESTEVSDDVLGRLGGTLHGTVMEFTPGREFFVADLYWHPPEGDPIGPMALTVTCLPMAGNATLLRVRQSGHDQRSARWSRYYEVISDRWIHSLRLLKSYVENSRQAQDVSLPGL